MKISVLDAGSQFRVESNSGNTYEITYAGSGDADPEYVALWECSCPCYKFRGTCKHLKLFLDSRLMDYGDPYYDDDDLPNFIEC